MFFVFFSSIMLLLNLSEGSAHQRDLIAIFTLFFLFQKGHNAVTFILLSLPEYRDWLAVANYRNLNKIIFCGLAVFICFFCYFFIKHIPLLKDIAFLRSKQFGHIFWLTFWTINFWHTFRQYYGLSMLYNSISYENGASMDQEKDLKIAKLEKNAYIGLSTLSTIGCAYFLVFGFSRPFRLTFIFTTLVSILLIIVICSGYSEKLRNSKLVFNIRLFLIPLMPISFLAGIGMNVNHNFEYMLTFKKIVSNSKVKASLFSIAFGFSIFFLHLGFATSDLHVSRVYKTVNIFFKNHDILHASLLTFSVTITTFHYFLDGFIFKFSDPVTRRDLLPLLKKGA